MSTEDKIAAIRREIEERYQPSRRRYAIEMAHLARTGVVIYGVPLSESEVTTLRGMVERSTEELGYCDNSRAIWEMLERGKK